MSNLITITEVAKKLGVSYHVARNRLSRNPETAKLSQKLGHTVIYDIKVLEIIKDDVECDQ